MSRHYSIALYPPNRRKIVCRGCPILRLAENLSILESQVAFIGRILPLANNPRGFPALDRSYVSSRSSHGQLGQVGADLVDLGEVVIQRLLHASLFIKPDPIDKRTKRFKRADVERIRVPQNREIALAAHHISAPLRICTVNPSCGIWLHYVRMALHLVILDCVQSAGQPLIDLSRRGSSHEYRV